MRAPLDDVHWPFAQQASSHCCGVIAADRAGRIARGEKYVREARTWQDTWRADETGGYVKDLLLWARLLPAKEQCNEPRELSQLTEPTLSMLAGLTLNEGIVRTAILQTIIDVCRSKCSLWVEAV